MNENLDLENLKFPVGHFIKPNSITQTDIKNWLVTIASFPLEVKKLSENLSTNQLQWKYRPDGWSIKQVVHHCADSHMNSFIRFKLALTENIPMIKSYEEADWALLTDGNSDDITPSLQILDGVHARWTLLIKHFTDSDFARQFQHPANKKIYTLDEALGLYAWHCNHHLAHIKQAVQYQGEFN